VQSIAIAGLFLKDDVQSFSTIACCLPPSLYLWQSKGRESLMLNKGFGCSPVSCPHNVMQKEVAEKETEARNKRKVQEIAGTAKDEAAARAIKATQEYEKAFARANPGAAAMVIIASLKGLLCSMTGSSCLLHISRIATLCTQAGSLQRSSAELFSHRLIHCARSPHQGLCARLLHKAAHSTSTAQ